MAFDKFRSERVEGASIFKVASPAGDDALTADTVAICAVDDAESDRFMVKVGKT